MPSVLAAFARASFRQQSAYRVANLAGLFTNTAFLLFRASVMAACYQQREVVGGLDAADATTFVVVTQATLMVAPAWGTVGLAADVRTGQIAVELLRPVDLFAVAMARRLGASAWFAGARMLPLLLVGALTGNLQPPDGLLGAATFVVSLALGAFIGTSLLFLYELSAFWLESDRGVRMLGGGLAAVASGLLLPLSWYPPVVRGALEVLPWAGTLDAPARLWIGVGPEEVVRTLALQVVWAVLLAGICRAVLARGARHLSVSGG